MTPTPRAPGPNARPALRTRSVVYAPFTPYDVELKPGTRPIHLYLRLSKYHRDGADAIERQRIDLKRKLEADGGWTAMGEYVDNDSASASAARTRRGWHALNAAIDAGTVEAVAFWKLDRTNRIAARLLEWLGHCRELGVELVSHQDPSDELNKATAGAKLVTGIKALLAEVETDTMSERQKAAKAHAAEAGFNHGGTVPFGWALGGRENDAHGRSGRRLVPHPVEFPALSEAVEMAVRGESLTAIADCWADKYGITTATGRRVYLATIRRALTSPRLMGYRMRQVPEFERGVQLNLMDFVVRDSEGNPIVAHEPVCDRVTFERLQRSLKSRQTGTLTPWGSRDWLLTGLVFCPGCDGTLSGSVKTWKRTYGDTAKMDVYRCLANARRGKGSCHSGVSIARDGIEGYVMSWLRGFLNGEHLSAARAEEKARSKDDGRQAELDEAREELAALRAQQGSKQFRGAMVTVLLGMISDAQDRVTALEARNDATPASDLSIRDGNELVERWGAMGLAEKRHFISQCVVRIDVTPGKGSPENRVKITPRF